MHLVNSLCRTKMFCYSIKASAFDLYPNFLYVPPAPSTSGFRSLLRTVEFLHNDHKSLSLPTGEELIDDNSQQLPYPKPEVASKQPSQPIETLRFE